MRVLVVEPGKQPEEREIDGSLESMQQIVGGLIQAIYPFDDTVALICNDEGKLLGLPWNRVVGYDIIAGTFFLCDAPPDSENFESLSESQSVVYKQYFFLVQASLFAEQGISLQELASCMKKGESTIRLYFKEIRSNGMLKKHQAGRQVGYSLDLRVVNGYLNMED